MRCAVQCYCVGPLSPCDLVCSLDESNLVLGLGGGRGTVYGLGRGLVLEDGTRGIELDVILQAVTAISNNATAGHLTSHSVHACTLFRCSMVIRAPR